MQQPTPRYGCDSGYRAPAPWIQSETLMPRAVKLYRVGIVVMPSVSHDPHNPVIKRGVTCLCDTKIATRCVKDERIDILVKHMGRNGIGGRCRVLGY